MTLRDKVRIGRRFQRAIRIDVDLNAREALEGYVFPRSSAEVLLALARHVAETRQGAFTWTGPYGSGKSSLAVAFAAFLGGERKMRKLAATCFGADVAADLSSKLPLRRRGWHVVAAVGKRESLAHIIGEALDGSGLLPRRKRHWTDKVVVETLQDIAAAEQHGGLLLLIDEMGKVLEGAAQGDGDVFLFQQLAEAASRSGGRFVIVGILHQAFEEYANRLSRDVRDEWAKVQGRFVDLVVNAAGEEQIELISRAIEAPAPPKSYRTLARQVAGQVQTRKAVSRHLEQALAECWPLHPIVAGLLGPLSRRRFGQNQRSVFGFLNSAEQQGFQDFLRDAGERDLYGPVLLWEYLRLNLEPSILASPDGHRWSIAVDAIERCEALGGDLGHVNLLKVIALIDLFKERSGLIPSEALLAICFPEIPAADLKRMLDQLVGWSVIIFKRFAGGYALYAGSDFDIDAAAEAAGAGIKDVDFRLLRSLAGLQPVLAKRHYHDTGALRWFDVEIVPLSEALEFATAFAAAPNTIGLYLLAIPTQGESDDAAKDICRRSARCSGTVDIVVGLTSRSWTINHLARELLALERVKNDNPALLGDPVARREVAARLASLQAQLEDELQRAFDGAQWFQKQHAPRQLMQDELNGLASELAAKRFPLSPKIKNELLNRLKPSSNAVAAQNALLRRMVDFEGTERLGIKGFPAEGGLLVSLLEDTNLYSSTPSGWRFAIPGTDAPDKASLRPLWDATVDFLHARSHEAVSLADIYAEWRRPPYGVKDGVMPVLAVAFILSKSNEVALYRQGVFQARFTDLDVDYLAKDPHDIQLRWMNLTEVARRLLSGLAEVVRQFDKSNALQNLEPIDVGRGLIGIYTALPPWARRTMRLSANAIRIRDLFKKARDPNQFIFNDLPRLIGGDRELDSGEAFEQVVQSVREALDEMVHAYPQMLQRLADNMLAELQVPNSSGQALSDLRARAENVRDLGGDFRLNAFVNRLSAYEGRVEDIEGLAGLAANKPATDWIDVDLDRASVEIADLSQRFNRSEAFARVKGRRDKRHAMAVVVGMGGRPAPFLNEFDVTDADLARVQALTERLRGALRAEGSLNTSIVLAALAQLSAEHMRAAPVEDDGREEVAAR